MNKYIKRIWIPSAVFIIVLAIVFSVFRALTPWAKEYKGEIEQHLSTVLGQPVTIQTLETGWYWFQPVLKLDNVALKDQENKDLILDKLFIGIDLLSSLWHWHLQPGLFYIDKVNLNIKQTDSGWEIDGLQQNQTVKFDPNTYYLITSWLLSQKKIVIKEVSATVQLQNGMVLPLRNVSLTVKNHYGRYKLKGQASLQQENPTAITFLADLEINPNNWKKIYGNVYVSLNNFYPAQWQSFFPNREYHVDQGVVNMRLWLDIEKGQVVNAQSELNLDNVIWSKIDSGNKYPIDSLAANLAWQPTRGGWKLSGDKIQLKTKEMTWPENSLLIEHQDTEDFYRVFIEKLLLRPLLTADVEWPEPLLPFLKLNAESDLLFNQIEIKNKQVNYILSQFKNLHWQAHGNIPAVNSLSGVVYWQPDEGRIEIDSQNVELQPINLPPVTFKEINGSLDWKELSHGTRIALERLVISHPQLIFSAQGAWDAPSAPTGGLLRMTGKFSAENAEQWIKYIPPQYLKAKLNTWLKNDIKRVGLASGEFNIHGLVNDFPFDQYPGEFTVNTYLHDVDLIFKEGWPLTRGIEGHLFVNKRTLEANIIRAELLNVVTNAINLRVENLGLHDTMYIHGKVETPGNAALNYIVNSPLRNKLMRLQALDIDGLLDLDLKLEIPLYSQNDKVLARGTVTFNDNNMVVHHSVKDINVNNINGMLLFDQEGVTNSALEAVLWGDPVSLHVRSVRNDTQPYTELSILGNTTIEVLKNKFNLAIFSLMEGHLALEGVITLTDDPNDLDHIQINTDLQGAALKLPAPFGKKFDQLTPLTVGIDFNPKKAIRLRMNYNQLLSSDLWVVSKKKGFVLSKGEIHFGEGESHLPEEKGIEITGRLSSFNWQEWSKLLSKVPAEGTSSPMQEKIHKINVKIDSLLYNNLAINDIAINAAKKGEEDWYVTIQQKAIDAQLHYLGKEHAITGNIAHLELDKSMLSNQENNKAISQLTPEKIPNLSLTINDLVIGKVNLGSVILQSKSSPTRWSLEQCKINTPAYTISLKGSWVKNEDTNRTDLEGYMKISDLGQTLIRWDISPAVEADDGEVNFKGGWRGGINEFGLGKLNGEMYLGLEDGRITHLSSETEKKLGMGKLLSILSLQTIPRRLKLDFSDLSHEGYSFDEFKGSFVIKNGVMHTEDSYIDGPVAYASMNGDLDLVKKLYNVDLQVNPHITASLPIVATIAGGPIAGLATWVASKIINRSMQKISGYTYTVTGPWLDPVVQQVNIFRKKEN